MVRFAVRYAYTFENRASTRARMAGGSSSCRQSSPGVPAHDRAVAIVHFHGEANEFVTRNDDGTRAPASTARACDGTPIPAEPIPDCTVTATRWTPFTPMP